jgi:DNA-binding GntR family transcriptional regulator
VISKLRASAAVEQELDEVTPRGTYRQIADDVRKLIVSGRLLPGAKVPSEMSLVEQYGVARGTVRSALAVLVDEGLIEVVPGQGRRVVGDDPGRPPDTAWARVAAALRQRLEAGEFGQENPMPSEAELIDEFGVSRNTVRRAYQHLVEAGLVVVRHGAGAFPAPR